MKKSEGEKLLVENTDTTENSTPLSKEEIDELILEHQGWAESIARSVARSWSMDWRSDGLDGAAMEALIFCARRFDPSRGVPFKGYARRRIHEASTEEARQSKSWKMGKRYTPQSKEQKTKELSVRLLEIFPELREGYLPGDDDDVRGSIRTLLVGASLTAARDGISSANLEEFMDFKRIVEQMAILEPVHQHILWQTYWEGNSLRNIASGWETDELNVIREHKVLIEFLAKTFQSAKKPIKPKVRPGLRAIAYKLKKESSSAPFSILLETGHSEQGLED